VRFRHILFGSVAVAVVANVGAYVAWEIADGAEDMAYFLLRFGAVVAALTGAAVGWKARGGWEQAVGAGLFSAMLSFVLAWVAILTVVLLNPPS
jgi:hypothetical protein